jgi:hypothetical protein
MNSACAPAPAAAALQKSLAGCAAAPLAQCRRPPPAQQAEVLRQAPAPALKLWQGGAGQAAQSLPTTSGTPMPRSAKAFSTSAEREHTPVALRQALPLLQRHQGQRARHQVKAATADAQPAVWPDPPQGRSRRRGGGGRACCRASRCRASCPLLCLQRRRPAPHRPCPRTAGLHCLTLGAQWALRRAWQA